MESFRNLIREVIKEALSNNSDNDNIVYLLGQILDLELIGAPKLEIMTVVANDLEGANTNKTVSLPNTLASYETRQKYIVPYKGKIRIPCPVGNNENWNIYELTLEDLSKLVKELQSLPNPKFTDIYDIAERIGKFLFSYY